MRIAVLVYVHVCTCMYVHCLHAYEANVQASLLHGAPCTCALHALLGGGYRCNLAAKCSDLFYVKIITHL